MKAVVIGLGRMGLRHVAALERLGVEIVAAADGNPATHQSAVDQGVKGDRIFSNAEDALVSCAADLLVISTTAPSHAPIAISACEKGFPYVLCEKPLATSLTQCDMLIETVARCGTAFAVNHQMRFMDQYRLPREALLDDRHGGMSSMHVVAGNFGIAMNGCHYFEAFRYASQGKRVRGVSARFSSQTVANPRGQEFSDRAGIVSLEADNGVRFHLDASADQGHGVLVSYLSRNGRIVIDELSGEYIEVCRRLEHRELPTTRYGMPADVVRKEIEPADAVIPTMRLIEALLGGGDYPTVTDGAAAVEILVAAYASDAQDGRVVDIGSATYSRSQTFPWA